MPKKIYGSLAEHDDCTALYNDYVPTVGRQMETVNGDMASVRDNGATHNDDITTTPQITFHP